MSQPSKTVTIHSDDCRSVEFDPSCRYFASTSFDQTCKLYDIANQKVTATLKAHVDKIVLAKWHPFFPLLISTSADGTVKVFASKTFLDAY